VLQTSTNGILPHRTSASVVRYRYIVEEACPLTELADDGLLQLHSADDAAVKWLEDTAAMKALAK